MKKFLPLIFALQSAVSAASIIEIRVVEPDDFAPGTNISNATPGVHLYTLAGSDIYAGAFSPDSLAIAPTGTQAFATESGGMSFHLSIAPGYTGNIWNQNAVQYPDQVLIARFDNPTDMVTFQSGGWNPLPLIQAYDMDGNRISPDSYTTTDVHFGPEIGGGREIFSTQEITTTTPKIGFVMLGGDLGLIRLDRLSFATVPEPSSLWLLGASMAGLFGVRRLRQERSCASS